MCLNMAKTASMPQVYIHNESFEPNLTTIFKYLLSKPVRQNSLGGPFFGLKNRPTSGFWRTVLDSRYLNIDNRRKEVSTKLWYSTIGRSATHRLSSFSGVAHRSRMNPFCSKIIVQSILLCTTTKVTLKDSIDTCGLCFE